ISLLEQTPRPQTTSLCPYTTLFRSVNTGIQRIIDAIKQEDDIWQHFVEPEEAEDIVTSRSLIVVVDTHKPAMVSNETTARDDVRSEEHTSELQSRFDLVCRLLLDNK